MTSRSRGAVGEAAYDEFVSDQGPELQDAAEAPMDAFRLSPFARLARVHLVTIAGDALFTIALAGSIFFDVSVDKATAQVTLYLLLTIAPFAVAAPLIGPALDSTSGGRRWMVVAANATRAILCLFLVQNLGGLMFFPLAFAMLVAGKSYQISKSAIVPTTVHSDAGLVEANSKLALLSGVGVAVAAGPGVLISWALNPSVVVGSAAILFGISALMAVRLPPAVVAPEPPDEMERSELHSAAVRLSVSAMGILRGAVGFLAFLVAFTVRRADDPVWHLGAAAVAAQIGYMAGAALAPVLRRTRSEEVILAGSLAGTGVVAALMVLAPKMWALVGMSAALGLASSAGKQGFDSIVQRDAPDANRGRSFAQFETRFQLVWVVGALIPVALPVPFYVGLVGIAGITSFSAMSFMVGLRRARSGQLPPPLGISPWTARIGGMWRGWVGGQAAASPMGPVSPGRPMGARVRRAPRTGEPQGPVSPEDP